MRAVLVVLTLVMLVPGAVVGQGLIGLHAEANAYSSPEVIGPPFVPFTYHIILTAPEPVSSVMFRVVRTGDLATDAFLVGYDDLGYNTLGTVESGIEIDFGGCVSGEVVVGTVSYIATADIECAWLDIMEPANHNSVEASLCAGGTILPYPQSGYYSSQEPHYFNRYPADGAVDVPTDVTLSWAEYYCFIFGDCFGAQCRELDFGTDPENLDVFFGIGTSVTPGPLDPFTTYYWSVGTNELSLELWSFTTGQGPLATEESTWGRIKSLYR